MFVLLADAAFKDVSKTKAFTVPFTVHISKRGHQINKAQYVIRKLDPLSKCVRTLFGVSEMTEFS